MSIEYNIDDLAKKFSSEIKQTNEFKESKEAMTKYELVVFNEKTKKSENRDKFEAKYGTQYGFSYRFKDGKELVDIPEELSEVIKSTIVNSGNKKIRILMLKNSSLEEEEEEEKEEIPKINTTKSNKQKLEFEEEVGEKQKYNVKDPKSKTIMQNLYNAQSDSNYERKNLTELVFILMQSGLSDNQELLKLIIQNTVNNGQLGKEEADKLYSSLLNMVKTKSELHFGVANRKPNKKKIKSKKLKNKRSKKIRKLKKSFGSYLNNSPVLLGDIYGLQSAAPYSGVYPMNFAKVYGQEKVFPNLLNVKRSYRVS